MPLLKKWRRKVRSFFRLIYDTLSFSLQFFLKRPLVKTILCINAPGSVGGTEFLVAKIAEQLTHQGEKIVVMTTGIIAKKKKHLFLQRLKKGNILYLTIGTLAHTKNRWLTSYLAFLLKKSQSSHCHLFNPAAAAVICAAKKAGMNIIYRETGLPKNDRWWAPLFGRIAEIDQVIGVSQASLRAFQTLFDYEGPTDVVYPLIDLPPQSILGGDQEDLRIVYFGRIYRDKGVKHLLASFRLLLSQFPSSHLTYIGEGPDRDFLQAQVIEWGLQANVFFQGFESKESLWQKLHTFNLFCLPSLSEGAPCSILEAMSIGLTVVASRVGGIPELIEEGVSGILVEPNDPQGLFEALSLCAENRSYRRKVGIEGRKRFLTHFAK